MEDETKLTCNEWLEAVIELAESFMVKKYTFNALNIIPNAISFKRSSIKFAIKNVSNNDPPEVKEYLQYALDELKICQE